MFEVLVLILLFVNLSFNLDIPILCEANLEVATDSSNFSVRGNPSLNQRGFITYNHGIWSSSLCESGTSFCV